MVSTASVVRQLKANDEDHEWYPSSSEIIRIVTNDMCAVMDEYRHGNHGLNSVLDIGAGDGRVLVAIRDALHLRNSHNSPVQCFAIEKAIYHQSNMPKDIVIIGTDFEQQALADKTVGAIFSNPPYSVFEEWVLKIVREASTKWIYLVIPRRWRNSVEIKRAIDKRSGEVTSLGEFDFSEGDRVANAKVEVVRIEYGYEDCDAFASVIEDMMPEMDVFDVELPTDTVLNRDLFQASDNVVEALVDAYDHELMNMLENYRAALRIDPSILKEIGVSKASVIASIRFKIKGLKDTYWRELFDRIDTVTQRLATRQRKQFLESLKSKVTIDFTCNNVYAVLIWVSKWANDYYDEQLIDLFRTLSTDSCVVKYKSNHRVWTQSGWRYNRKSDFLGEGEHAATHYKLEYRIVISHGGISLSDWDFKRNGYCGLAENAFDLLVDIVTVANNLGFPCKDSPRNYQWKSNKQNTLLLTDGTPLVAVRAFQNGNMHMHFNPKVMLAINVEAGRLLRWIRNPAEACAEMGVTGEEAKQVTTLFGSSYRITPDAGFLSLAN